MPNPYKSNQRRKKAGKKGKGSAANTSKITALSKKLANLKSLSSEHTLPSPAVGNGSCPIPEEERQHVWSKEQIDRFLQGDWSDDSGDDDEDDDEIKLKVDEVANKDLPELESKNKEKDDDELQLEVAFREMPPPQNNTVLGPLLDPNAGGGNGNLDGLAGLFAAQMNQKKQQQPANAKERLRARLRYMQNSRGRNTEEDVVRDARGRVVRGARQITAEDRMYGGAQLRKVTFDKAASNKLQKQHFEQLREQVALQKQEN